MMQEPIKVLAVDDVQENLLLLDACLGDLDLEIVRARTGEEGLELCESEEFALILLDVKMPGIDGFEMARRVRVCEHRKGIPPTPILFLTCSITEHSRTDRAYARGAIDFLFKPFDPVVLRAKVSVLTNIYRQRREIERQAEMLARSEDALRRQTSILQAILDSMGDGVIVADERGGFLVFNPAAERMVGLAASPCQVGAWAERYRLYHADRRTPYVSEDLPLARALRDQHSDDVEVYIDNPNALGGVLTRCKGRPVRDDAGRLIGGVVTFQDVTEQRRAEALKEGQRLMLEQLAGGGDLREVLESFVRVVESQSSDMLCSVLLLSPDGKRLTYGAAPSLPDAYNAAIDGISIGPSVGSCGTAAFRRERVVVEDIATDPLWVDFRDLALAYGLRACWSQPIIAPDGEMLGTFAIYYRHTHVATPRDLQLIEMAALMVSIAVKRKRNEERLQGYARRLARSNQELQHFVSVASHDLQEPLRKIRAFGDLLRKKANGSLGVEAADYVERMTGAASRMQTLIDNLLDYSRVQTRGNPFVLVDLSAVAREVLTDLEIRVAQSGGRVELGELGEIEADPTQMRQLLQNLIGNALKFHPPDRTPVVKVYGTGLQERRAAERNSAAPDRNSTGLYQIFVEDNGIGFDEGQLERIFGVFQRLHSRNDYEGTGIGLAICRRIVERHRGHITAHSRPSEGATFVVTLPATQPAE